MKLHTFYPWQENLKGQITLWLGKQSRYLGWTPGSFWTVGMRNRTLGFTVRKGQCMKVISSLVDGVTDFSQFLASFLTTEVELYVRNAFADIRKFGFH